MAFKIRVEYSGAGQEHLDRVTQIDETNGIGGVLINRSQVNYDNLGRVYETVKYAVDPATGTTGNTLRDQLCYDAAETAYADAANITGDTVLQKFTFGYDAASNVTSQVKRERFHDATGTG